jgi:hypothetical protein
MPKRKKKSHHGSDVDAAAKSLVAKGFQTGSQRLRTLDHHEVLPALRKTGGYRQGVNGMSKLEILARGHLIAREYIQQLNSQVAEMRPMVEGFELHLGKFDTIKQAMDAVRQHSMVREI